LGHWKEKSLVFIRKLSQESQQTFLKGKFSRDWKGLQMVSFDIPVIEVQRIPDYVYV
jgi:hypothetical protein